MTETAPEAAPTAEQPPSNQPEGGEQQTAAEETDWKAEARKWEQRAKENRQAAAELEKQRKAAMTESERAVAEAEERGRTAAASDFGKRLATSEIRAAAADAGADLAGVFDYLDLGRFVGEDGEPDTKAIQAFVSGLPRKEAAPPPGLDLGARPPVATGLDMSQRIRKAAGRA